MISPSVREELLWCCPSTGAVVVGQRKGRRTDKYTNKQTDQFTWKVPFVDFRGMFWVDPPFVVVMGKGERRKDGITVEEW